MIITGAAAVSVMMRLRMLWSPVSVDEGGYLAIARGWAHGQVLYRDVFVDRPQGLLVLFRVWDWASGGSTGSIRVMAMLFGVLLVVSTGIVVRELAGDVAARLAAMICAVVSAAPVLEGYAANTELLSGAMSAAGLAVGVLALSKRRPLVWFFASGVLAGLALSLKQSGFDGMLALLVWLTLGVMFCATQRATAMKAVAALLAGLTIVVGALMLHGALTGWSSWWAAVAGYRLKTQSAFAGADWRNLARTAPLAAVVLGTSAFLAVLGIGTVTRGLRRRVTASLTPGPLVLLAWFVAATMAFFIGGGFWRHYWLLLAAPLSALAGVGLAQLPRFRYLMLAATVLPCLVISAWVYAGDPARISFRADGDRRSAIDQLVAKWFDVHRQPGQNMYVLCASAARMRMPTRIPGTRICGSSRCNTVSTRRTGSLDTSAILYAARSSLPNSKARPIVTPPVESLGSCSARTDASRSSAMSRCSNETTTLPSHGRNPTACGEAHPDHHPEIRITPASHRLVVMMT